MSSIYSNSSVHGPGDVVVDVNHQVSLPPQVELPHSVELPQPSYQVELPLQEGLEQSTKFRPCILQERSPGSGVDQEGRVPGALVGHIVRGQHQLRSLALQMATNQSSVLRLLTNQRSVLRRLTNQRSY